MFFLYPIQRGDKEQCWKVIIVVKKQERQKQVLPWTEDLFPHKDIVIVPNGFYLDIKKFFFISPNDKINSFVVNFRSIDIKAFSGESHFGKILSILSNLKMI